MTWGSTQIAKPDSESAPRETAPPEGSGKALRAVLVDERSDRRGLTRTIIDVALGAGTVVAEVGNFREALTAVERHRADAVLLELRTPLVEWLAGIAQLRATDQSLVIVVCTFRADLATRFQACDAGADAYLVKPVSARELRRALDPVQRGLAIHATKGIVEPPITFS
jgi:DNA-binding response OmpR family regulator